MFNIDDLAKNRFSIDFNKIFLSNKSGKTYSGAGNIFQNPDGNLELKMYTYDEEGYKLIGGLNKSKAGKIIPNVHYFRFEAYDSFDTKWNSNRINLGYELSSNHKNLILRAPIYYLSRKLRVTITKFDKPQFVIRFKKNIKFPAAYYIDEKAKSYKNISNLYRVGLIANFIHCNYEFLFYETENWYVSEIFSLKGRLNEKLITYICEALQFILSTNIYWVVLQKLEGNTDKIQIKEIRNSASSRIPSPIPLNSSKVSDIWKLFKKYFDFVNSKGLSDYHTISSKLHNLIQASSGAIELQALSVTTLIENVITTEIPFYSFPNKFEKEINRLIEQLEKNNFTDEFIKRIKGFLLSLKSRNVKNVFNYLIESGILSKSDLEAWNKLRNPISHGRRIELTEYQKYLTLCYRCQKIFNILIFLIIGYKGIYSDLGKYGFPTKKFRKSITS